MKRFIGRDTEVLRYFPTYSPLELRFLSYRGTYFYILCRRSLLLGIGTTVTLIFSSVILKTLTLTRQEFLQV